MTLNYGIKVSEPGFDVKTASSKNLSLKSGLTLLKVYKQGSLTLSNSGFNNTVSHSLGYIPQYLVFVKDLTYSPVSVFLAHGWFGEFEVPPGIAKISTTTLSIYKTSLNCIAFYYIFYEPVDTGTAPSVISSNNYGIKVTKDGYNINNANILQQTFNSEKNSLKIITDGFATSTASGSRNITIPHGLSFMPGFLVFYEVDNNGKWFFDMTTEDVSGKNCSTSSRTNANNLIISILSDSSAIVKVHYYILADPGESV